MRATEILLLRHGQSEGNQQGTFGGHGPTPLTALGRAQAAATGRVLAAEGGLSAIYSSDLPRALDTARAVSQATGVDIVTTEGLRERSVGVFTGLTFTEAEEKYPEAFAALMRRESEVCPPEGETHAQCSARALAVLDEAVARNPSGRTLLVSHALTLYLLVLHILGVEHGTHSRKLFVRSDNCALHRLRRTPEGLWTVLALNDKSHLRDVTESEIDEV